MKWLTRGDLVIQIDNFILVRTGLMTGLAAAFVSSRHRAWLTSKP